MFSAGHVVVICDVVEVALLVTGELACTLCGELDYAPERAGAPAHVVLECDKTGQKVTSTGKNSRPVLKIWRQSVTLDKNVTISNIRSR